ncbi:replication initiation protein [Leuconostoc citreum]|uniref:replication initiation protein n=1 Tax=Leuconostoc citreum TaxID=33964 RepID=UPI002151A4B3|nr:replication initiation protein [Leuconostoc citreum]
MSNENKEFKNRNELLKYLNISQATFYRKANSKGISTKELSFTQKELSDLRRNYHDNKIDNFENKKNTQHHTNSQNYQYIITLENELKEKNIQISNAQKLIEQSQKLQLIAEQRLTETNKILIEYQEKEKNPKKGFWSRLFGGNQ